MAKAKRPPRGAGSIYRRPNSPFLWICYSRKGKTIRKSTGTSNLKEAERMLSLETGRIATGTDVDPKMQKITVADLAERFLRDYRNNNKKSINDAEARWKLHLEPFFGHYRAVDVGPHLVSLYVDKGLAANAANGTVNRELAALKRMFNLANEADKNFRVPHISMLAEDNVRTGFLESEQYLKLADHFGSVGLWMRSLFECGYTFGWRVSELLNLRVKQLDLEERIIRLNTGETKNKKGRVVKMTTTVFQLMQQCCHGKSAEDFVFTRIDRKPVKDFRAIWENGCKVAGVPDLMFHDLRRTAVRNMVRAGIPEHQAMKISGHRTRSVFDRYDIVNERDIADSVQKLEAHQTKLHTAHNCTLESSTEKPVRAN
jgi:integrase